MPEVDPPPDVEFTFVLQVNDKFYSKRDYELYDSNGKRVYRKYNISEQTYSETTDPQATGVDVPFRTDNNGMFTLKDGQAVRFPDIGTGASYKVFEEDIDGRFVQTQPPGNAAQTGTIQPNGSTATFINTWYPESKSQVCSLQVEKSVLLPDGFEIPESPEFTFKLSIRYRPYAYQDFILYTFFPDDTGFTSSVGTTDGEGKFKLKAGQIASFENLEAGLDYRVEELLDESEGTSLWRQTGTTQLEGATKAPYTYVSVTNTEASFAVTKRMRNASLPDTEFSFTLTSEGKPLAASYYLYDRDHHLVEKSPRKTGEDGKFTLKAGQTALFVGIAPGTNFSVTEENLDGFIKATPDDGYSGTVEDGSIEMFDFINDYDNSVKLNIHKYNEDNNPVEGAGFKLKQGFGGLVSSTAKFKKDGKVWVFDGWSMFDGTEVYTDEDGNLVLKGLQAGTYTLTESKTPPTYDTIDDVLFTLSVSEGEVGLENASLTLRDDQVGREDVSFEGSLKDGTGVLKLLDKRAPILPHTGGAGETGMIAGCILTVAIGILFMILATCKKE